MISVSDTYKSGTFVLLVITFFQMIFVSTALWAPSSTHGFRGVGNDQHNPQCKSDTSAVCKNHIALVSSAWQHRLSRLTEQDVTACQGLRASYNAIKDLYSSCGILENPHVLGLASVESTSCPDGPGKRLHRRLLSVDRLHSKAHQYSDEHSTNSGFG